MYFNLMNTFQIMDEITWFPSYYFTRVTNIFCTDTVWGAKNQNNFLFLMTRQQKEVKEFLQIVAKNSFLCFFVVSETEKRRLQDAFRRSSAANSIISKQVTPGNNLRIFCRINLFIFRFLSKMYWANAFLVLYQNKFLVSLEVEEVSPLENFWPS